jgi:hypothetical protein
MAKINPTTNFLLKLFESGAQCLYVETFINYQHLGLGCPAIHDNVFRSELFKGVVINNIFTFVNTTFLGAKKRLYKRLRWSVGPSVHWLVGRSLRCNYVENWLRRDCFERRRRKMILIIRRRICRLPSCFRAFKELNQFQRKTWCHFYQW